MQFYLGTHVVSWLRKVEFPLFISHRRLFPRASYPEATCDWVLDSGGFSELSIYGTWGILPKNYAKYVLRYKDEIGRMQWAAPMDWMCEPKIIRKTGLSVQEHQRRTIENFLELRGLLGELVIPVLQGWTVEDYEQCVELYDRKGVDLRKERVVGVGSVCRRQGTDDAKLLFERLAELGIQAHGFGVKLQGLVKYQENLTSADSMAWSTWARYEVPLQGCTHLNCANCLKYAVKWRNSLLAVLAGKGEVEWGQGDGDLLDWQRVRRLREPYGSLTGS